MKDTYYTQTPPPGTCHTQHDWLEVGKTLQCTRYECEVCGLRKVEYLTKYEYTVNWDWLNRVDGRVEIRGNWKLVLFAGFSCFILGYLLAMWLD